MNRSMAVILAVGTILLATASNADEPQDLAASEVAASPIEAEQIEASGIETPDDPPELVEDRWGKPAPGSLDADSPFRDVCGEERLPVPCSTADFAMGFSFPFAVGPAIAYSLTDGNSEGFSAEPGIAFGITLLANLIFNQATKRIAARPRPLTYSPHYLEAHGGVREQDALSFYSGHTSTIASNLFFAATAYSLYDSKPDPAVSGTFYAIATAATVAVGMLRVEAGKHFWSDVIVGGIAGAAVGVLGPVVGQATPDAWISRQRGGTLK